MQRWRSGLSAIATRSQLERGGAANPGAAASLEDEPLTLLVTILVLSTAPCARCASGSPGREALPFGTPRRATVLRPGRCAAQPRRRARG